MTMAVPAIPVASGENIGEWKSVFEPSRLAAASVGVALRLLAAVVLMRSANLPAILAPSILQWAVSIAFVTLLRAIGDFRLVGFFKQVRNSDFARMDAACYSSLCVLLALALAFIATN
jgi:hypothetical protein